MITNNNDDDDDDDDDDDGEFVDFFPLPSQSQKMEAARFSEPSE